MPKPLFSTSQAWRSSPADDALNTDLQLCRLQLRVLVGYFTRGQQWLSCRSQVLKMTLGDGEGVGMLQFKGNGPLPFPLSTGT